MPDEAIVVAPDLLPSEFLSLDRARLAGICTAGGGPTSHVAILAASAGIPMIVAAGPEVQNFDQLKVGGRMVVPVGSFLQDLQLIVKTADGIEKRTVAPVRFVPMTGEAQQKKPG